MPTLARPTRRTAPKRSAKAALLTYSAIVFPTGEIPEILETIGRRRMRSIDPCSREGRRLLASGQVRFWREPDEAPAAVRVHDLFRDLKAAARGEHDRHRPGEGAGDPCHSLDRWACVYTGHGKRTH
jgi:hypothetical protein